MSLKEKQRGRFDWDEASRVRLGTREMRRPPSSGTDLNDIVHGTCSKCGGPVTTPRAFMSTQQPIPTCKGCGATQKQPHGRVIEME
jgi:hypothetical protein